MIEASEQKIEELSQKLAILKAERDRLNNEAYQWAEKRDRLHGEIRKTRSEAGSLREKRDALNDEIQRLKNLREEDRRKSREELEQIRELRREVKKASAERPRRSSASLEEEIGKIEWRIQTESLPLDEERRLIEKVKTLETQMEVYRRIKSIQDKIAGLESGSELLRDEIRDHHAEITEIAEQSQGFHNKMLEKLKQIDGLKAEADRMHTKYVENREKAKAFQADYVETLSKIRALRNAVRAKEEEERARKQADLRGKMEKEALDKLRLGQKLTFEEFKLLAEQGKIQKAQNP